MKPGATIDFTDRSFSLPFGLPEDSVVGADLTSFEAELGVVAEFLELTWAAAPPFTTDEQPRDPFTGVLRSRFLKNSGGPGAVSIPTAFGPGVAAATDVGTLSFDRSTLDSIARRKWQAVSAQDLEGGVTMGVAMARSFRWDDDERKLWSLPQPHYADNALALFWPTGTAVGAPLGDDAAGILADDRSDYLLKTDHTTRNGELVADLLRSPVRGLVRFTRYRHVSVSPAATSVAPGAVLTRSMAGAMVIRTLPPSDAVPSDPEAPILRDSFLVAPPQ